MTVAGGWAYTAQFGGGFSGTISSEARRTTQIINENFASGGTSGTVTPGGFPAAVTAAGTPVAAAGSLFPGNGAYGGMQTTDFVGNLRVDQAWGGAQIMGALHQVNANYDRPLLAPLLLLLQALVIPVTRGVGLRALA